MARTGVGKEPLLRPRRPPAAARRMLSLTAAGLLSVGMLGVAWYAGGSSSVVLVGWNINHPTPEQRKIEREMRGEIAKGGTASPADKNLVSGLEHRTESLKALDGLGSTALAQDRALRRDAVAADAKATEALHRSRATKALADADDLLDGAPDVVKAVLGEQARADRASAQADRAMKDPAPDANEEYEDALEGYERLEEGMAPIEPSEKPSQIEMDARKDRGILEQRFKAPGTKQQLDKMSPAVVKQMMWDLKHPSAEERKIEREMQHEISQPGKAKAADKALIAGLERKVQSLEAKNKKIEALNSKVALTKAPPGASDSAMEHAEKVAAAAARKEEQTAMSLATSIVPKSAPSPALLHAEAVAKRAAAKEVKKEELAAKKFLHKKVKVDKLKLLGVKEDRMGGVRTALVAGQMSARKIPGVKEDTWPFAPGSFKYARKHPLPGVNEASWEVIPDFEGPKLASKGFKAHAGGCFPDGKGGLKCHGEEEKWMSKAKSWDKKRALPKKAPGTSLAMLLPHLRHDAKEQKLEAAAEAFGDSMSAANEPARTEELLLIGAKKARQQSLEQVANQCSNFLDCLAMQGNVMPQYTHPKYGAEDDRIVRTEEQSLSHTAMRDAFNPELRPWRLVSKWPFEAGDVKVKMPEYIGKISRPSVSSHHKSHMKYDVPAAELPSDRLVSMYARAKNQGLLKTQMLADKPEPKNNAVKPGARGLGVRNYENTVGVCKEGVNCDSSNWPFGEQDSMSDALVDAKRVQGGGLGTVGPWTPMMYTGNKPTSYDPGAAYIPDYQFLANRRRSAGMPSTTSQMLRMEQMQPQMMEEAEDEEGPIECPVCETCAEGDEECEEARADCMAEAESCRMAACGECEKGDIECEEAKEVCEAEAACLEGDNECIAEARDGFWSPMTGHMDKNEKEFEHMPRPQHHGAHTWKLPGVNVDSGWSPYKHADVWGYDRRAGAKSPDPEEGGQDEAVEAAPQTGLLSAAQDLPKEEWNAFDKMEHSDHNRAIGSLKHAWHSVVGGKEEADKEAHEEPMDSVEGDEPEEEEGDEGSWEQGPLYDADGGEETSTAEKVGLMKEAPSLHMQEEAGMKMEHDAEEERENAIREEQKLGQYLHEHYGVEMKGDTARTEVLSQEGDAGRKLLSHQEPRPAGKDSSHAAVMPRRARGRGKHSRPSRTKVSPGGVPEPDAQKTVRDLRRVRSAANKLGEGPWSLGVSLDSVVRTAMRHAGDDIRMLVGLGHVHHKDVRAGKDSSAKSARQLNAPKGKVPDGADSLQAKMKDLNALTADVDEVTTSDDIADMRGVDAKLHKLVSNMKARRADTT